MNVEKENMEPTHSEEEGEASNGVALPLTIGKKRKLVILDINGVLALMVRHSIPGGVSFPGGLTRCDEVVDYLLGDVKKKLLFVWDRSYCTRTGFMTPENRYIPLACKELKKIWGNECPNQPFVGGYYNESNTLLVDDSPYKAVLNPVHTAIFPHSYNEPTMINDRSLGPGGDLREYLEGLAGAEDVRNYVEGHPFGQKPIDYTHCNWKVYSGIIRALSDRS